MDNIPQNKKTREQIEAEIGAMQKKGAERDLADAKMREDLQRATEALGAIRKAREQKPDPTVEADAEEQRKEAQAIAEMERARAEAAAREEARVAAEKKAAMENPPVKLPPEPTKVEETIPSEEIPTKTFSPQYIGERITSLLREVVTVVRDPEVTGEDKEMTVKTTIEKWGGTVGIQAILENKQDGIGVKRYKIEATWMVKKLAEAFIGTELDKVSKLLKSYIEKEEKKEVAKMEIVNGELQVTFGATKPEKETLPTTPPLTEDTSEALASIQDPSESKPGWWKNLKRKALPIGLAGLAAGASFVGIKALNKEGKQDTKELAPIKEAVKNTATNETTKVYTMPETNLTARAEQKQLDQQKEIEKLRKEFESKFAEQNTAFSNQVAEIKAKVEKPAPQTHSEKIADIQRRLEEGKKRKNKGEPVPKEYRVTADEALLYNIEGMKQPTVVTGWTIETGGTTTTKKTKPKTPESTWVPPLGAKVTGGSVDAGGFNYSYDTTGDNFENPNKIPKAPEKTKINSKLSEQALEQVADTFDDNIEKIFPKDTLEKWNKQKGEGAYELMSKAEKKVPKAERALFSYLEKLKETTGLEPGSGVRGGKPETIEHYMQRALEKAAEEGKLEELKLK